jgi:hypothetical protein
MSIIKKFSLQRYQLGSIEKIGYVYFVDKIVIVATWENEIRFARVIQIVESNAL